MEWLTNEIIKNIPRLGETKGENTKTLWMKLYTPWVFQSWEVVEYDPEKRLCYGWVRGLKDEWCYFSLDEIEKIQGPYGLKIACDTHFTPTKLQNNGSEKTLHIGS